MPTLASSAASRRSQVSASSSPPPIACPFSAATDGYGYAASASIAAWNGWATSASAREVADVVARREHRPLRRDQQAARVELRQRGGERVEDLVVERVALGRIGDRQPGDVVRREVQAQLAAGLLH
jgi:hypothetical protein